MNIREATGYIQMLVGCTLMTRDNRLQAIPKTLGEETLKDPEFQKIIEYLVVKYSKYFTNYKMKKSESLREDCRLLAAHGILIITVLILLILSCIWSLYDLMVDGYVEVTSNMLILINIVLLMSINGYDNNRVDENEDKAERIFNAIKIIKGGL